MQRADQNAARTLVMFFVMLGSASVMPCERVVDGACPISGGHRFHIHRLSIRKLFEESDVVCNS